MAFRFLLLPAFFFFGITGFAAGLRSSIVAIDGLGLRQNRSIGR